MTTETYNFFTEAKIIKRAEHRSAVAAAAYRAGEKLMDLARGLTFDFTIRGGVKATKILAPKNAPDWVNSRQDLWNEVEQNERRKDAQLAREIRLQFPHELDLETQSNMLWEFCQLNFADEGMIADAAIHGPGKGDERNKHAHVMLTLRPLVEGQFGNKQRDWNNTDNLEKWKADWQRRCNGALAAIDSNIRFERKSITAQRAEKLAALEQSEDWLERRELEIEAARLNYIPRPYLSDEVYRAMVEGRKIAEGDEAIVAAWEEARESKQTARDEADRLQRKLKQDLSISPVALTEAPLERQPIEGEISTEDELAHLVWQKHVGDRKILAGILVLLAEQNPGSEFGALMVAAKDYELAVLEDRESWPMNGYYNLQEITDATKQMGWRKYPFVAEILRRAVDWSDEQLDMLTSERLNEVIEDETEVAAAQQGSNTDDQLSNGGDVTTTEGLEPPAPSGDNIIDTTAEPMTSDAAPQDAIALKTDEPADVDFHDTVNDKLWRSERIAQSRKRVLKGHTAIDRASKVWSSIKRNVGQQAPTLFVNLRAATDRFLVAASNLLQAWRDFLARLRGDDFKTEEDEYIEASNALLKAQASAEEPGDLTAEELEGEQQRTTDILNIEDETIIAPVKKSTLKRSEHISAYIASDEGRAVLEERARILKLHKESKRKEIEDKRRAEADRLLFDAAEKRVNLVKPVLEKARRDPRIRSILERQGFDMNQTDSWIRSDLSWHLVKETGKGSKLEIIKREIAELEERRAKTESSDSAEKPNEAPGKPDKTSTKTVPSDKDNTPDF